MTGFAFTQFGTLSGSIDNTQTTFCTIPPGSYGKNATVIVALVGRGLAELNHDMITLGGAGVPLGVATTANPPTMPPSGPEFTQPFIPTDNPPTVVNPLDLGVDVRVRYVFTTGGIYFVGVLSWSPGPDARDINALGFWMPQAGGSAATVWDVTLSEATGTIRSLPNSAQVGDPLRPPGPGHLRSDPSMPIAVGIYMGVATSSTPSIPTFASNPLLPGWQDIGHFADGQRVISVGQWTQSLAGLDGLGQVNGNFDVANMPGLSAASDAWGIIYCPVGQGAVLGGQSWVAVIG